MLTHKGIYYFTRYEDARDYADSLDWPTSRIIRYDLGWAVQWCVSGTYLGPDNEQKAFDLEGV